MNTHRQAQLAVLDVTEGFCPLGQVRLIVHGENACCPCGGCSFRVDGYSLLMTSCVEHQTKLWEHWQSVWRDREHSNH